MPRYPVRQAEILALAEAMISGYSEHHDYFPHSDPTLLQQLRDEYCDAQNEQMQAAARLSQAVTAKQQALQRLRSEMKRQLKLSQVDTADDPERLDYIKWAPRAQPHHSKVPGQPMQLQSADETEGILQLQWRRPLRNSGGPVQAYIIERRQPADSNQWLHVATAIDRRATLEDQPQGVHLEYRIRAINKAGLSEPSNTVTVVL